MISLFVSIILWNSLDENNLGKCTKKTLIKYIVTWNSQGLCLKVYKDKI